MRWLALSLLLIACQPVPGDIVAPHGTYLGSETRLLDGDLVNFQVKMSGAPGQATMAAYAECVASQYALVRGFGFARHLRTTIAEQAGIWTADTVYTISADLPDGFKTKDAEVVVADCKEQGIPTV